jgi:hypothetical protein
MQVGTPVLNSGLITSNAFVICNDPTPLVSLSLFLFRDGLLVDDDLNGGPGGAGTIVAEACHNGVYMATASATISYSTGSQRLDQSTGSIGWTCPVPPPPPTVVVANPGPRTTLWFSGARQQMTATGGVTPYTWSATGLPTGLSIDSSTGLILGRARVVGLFTVTVRAAPADGITPGSATFTWNVRRDPCPLC